LYSVYFITRIRFGEWNNKQLLQEQVLYAAGDAYYGLKIFENMIVKYNIYDLDDMTKFIDTTYNIKQNKINIKASKTGSKRPIYENYILLDKNGKFMTYCNKRVFYKNLNNGTLISENTIKTNDECFKDISNYHAELKENRCIMCNSETDLVRHRNIPHLIASKYNFINKKRKTSQYIQILCINAKIQ